MDKKDLLHQLLLHLQQDIDATLAAVDEAHALASHEESKPENQYDTLALEAAYLAHGQSERVAELQRQMMLLNHFELAAFEDDSRIAVGALVCIEELSLEDNDNSQESHNQWLWLLPVAGGVLLTANTENAPESADKIEVRTITAEAPLAKNLLGNYVGDEIELNLGHNKKQFEIIELL